MHINETNSHTIQVEQQIQGDSQNIVLDGCEYPISINPPENVDSQASQLIYTRDGNLILGSVLDGNVSEQTLLEVNSDFEIDSPVWSPDGKALAFILISKSEPNSHSQGELHYMNLETNEVFACEYIGSHPLFSPDGNWISMLDDSENPNLLLIPLVDENDPKKDFIKLDSTTQKLRLVPETSYFWDENELLINVLVDEYQSNQLILNPKTKTYDVAQFGHSDPSGRLSKNFESVTLSNNERFNIIGSNSQISLNGSINKYATIWRPVASHQD